MQIAKNDDCLKLIFGSKPVYPCHDKYRYADLHDCVTGKGINPL